MDQIRQYISDLVGRPVVSMSAGTKVGTVKDVLIDTEKMIATALLVSGAEGRGGLPFERILAIGSDAVMIDDAATIFWASATNPGPGREANDIKGLPVVNVDGEKLGTVYDIELLGQTVDTLDITAGGVFGLGADRRKIPHEAVRSIGPKLITIELPPAP